MYEYSMRNLTAFLLYLFMPRPSISSRVLRLSSSTEDGEVPFVNILSFRRNSSSREKVNFHAGESGSCTEPNQLIDWTTFVGCCAGTKPCEQEIYGRLFFLCRDENKCDVMDVFNSKTARRKLTGKGKMKYDKYTSLRKLTRYASEHDEANFQKEASFRPKLKRLSRRPQQNGQGSKRYASPFEHVCGGNANSINISNGNDGPTQFISFTNSGTYRETGQDCHEPFDKGQRRVSVSAKSVHKQGGAVVDLSDWNQAFTWCYQGGCLFHQQSKTHLCFEGSRTIAPWPFKCANRAYQLKEKKSGFAFKEWWTPKHRKLIAESCATWAYRAREVLILPNPDTFKKNSFIKGMFSLSTRIAVKTDREPAAAQCSHNMESDRCVSYNKSTHTVCCCSDPACNKPCTR